MLPSESFLCLTLQVLMEPLILGSTGVVHELPLRRPLTVWQRPGR